MKKAFNITILFLPVLVWAVWFLLALNRVRTNPDLGLVQIFLLLCLPVVLSLCNVIVTKDKRSFLKRNVICGAVQVASYYLTGILYYCLISGDSKTMLVNNTFSIVSIVYILLVNLVFYLVKAVCEKLKKKEFNYE
ncbi:MAG: hypothetical protein IJ435_09945 [Clostridia bacterium]|nr:hypothetical protein [Clostridia bacterium]